MDEKTAKSLLKKVVDDYDDISDEFDKTRKNKWKEFETFLPYIKDGDNLADIGCGNGRFYEFLKEYKNINYTGVDNSKSLLDKAKKAHNVSFIPGDHLRIPIKDKTQDVVVSIASLHHIPSDDYRDKAISELSRILKDKGILILTVWNLFQPKYIKYIGQNHKYDPQDAFIPWGKSGINRYYYAFKEAELERLLEEYFEIKKSYKGNNLVYICKKK